MPYVITTKQPDPVAKDQSKYRDSSGELRYSADDSLVYPGPTGVRPPDAYDTRRAVATLDEAKRRASGPVYAARMAAQINGGQERALYDAIEALPDTGGTIGPLPNGAVIEIEPVSWRTLAGGPWSAETGWQRRILADYNATV